MDKVEPLAVSSKQAQAMIGCSHNKFYALIAAGEVESYIDGNRRMCTMRSLKAYVQRKLDASANTKLATPPEPNGRKQQREAAAQAAA